MPRTRAPRRACASPARSRCADEHDALARAAVPGAGRRRRPDARPCSARRSRPATAALIAIWRVDAAPHERGRRDGPDAPARLREVAGRDDAGRRASAGERERRCRASAAVMWVLTTSTSRREPAHRSGDVVGACGRDVRRRPPDRGLRASARSLRRSRSTSSPRVLLRRASRSTNCSTPAKPSDRMAWRIAEPLAHGASRSARTASTRSRYRCGDVGPRVAARPCDARARRHAVRSDAARLAQPRGHGRRRRGRRGSRCRRRRRCRARSRRGSTPPGGRRRAPRAPRARSPRTRSAAPDVGRQKHGTGSGRAPANTTRSATPSRRGARCGAPDHLGVAADDEERDAGRVRERLHRDGQALALELVADEHRDRAGIREAELGAGRGSLAGLGRSEPLDVDAVRDDVDRRPDAA